MESLESRYRDVGTSSFAKPETDRFFVTNKYGQPVSVTYPHDELDYDGSSSTQNMLYQPLTEAASTELDSGVLRNLSVSYRSSNYGSSYGRGDMTFFAGIIAHTGKSSVFDTTSSLIARVKKLTKAIDTLSPELHGFLDQNALDRIDLFKSYEDGWDNRSAKKLSKGSIACLESFLRIYSRQINAVSVFLTPNGNLEILWSDEDGGDIELEFFPDKISAYIESHEIEKDFKVDEIESLIDTL